MENLDVSILSLILSFTLVLVAMFVSWKEKLGLNKEIMIAMIRMVVQLVIVGFILTYIFQLDSKIVTVLVMLFMVVNAAWNASKRADKIPHAFRISLVSIMLGVVLSLLVLVLSGSIKFIPAQMIPINGMLVGNAMGVIGLSFRNLNQAFHQSEALVNEKLALGATVKQASQEIIQEAIKGSLQPTIDTARTVGLVLLPGMMTGMMFAGTVPLKAIMYQILIYFMMMATSTITSYLAVYQGYTYYFNRNEQLTFVNLKH